MTVGANYNQVQKNSPRTR